MNKAHLIPIFSLSLLLPFAPESFAAKPPPAVAVSATTPPDFTTVESLTDFIPKDLDLRKAGKINPVGASMASEAMKARALGKVGQFRFKIQKIETAKHYGQKIMISSEHDHVTLHGGRFDSEVVAYFGAEQTDELAKLKEGMMVTIIGTFVRADLDPKGEGKIIFDLKSCLVIPAPAK